MVELRVTGFEGLDVALEQVARAAFSDFEMSAALRNIGFEYHALLNRQSFSDRPGLISRSGKLKNSVRTRVSGNTQRGHELTISIGDGLPYARTHEDGLTITPKKARALTVPLDSIRSPNGAVKFTLQQLKRKLGRNPVFSLQANNKGFLAVRFKTRAERNRVLGNVRKFIQLEDKKGEGVVVLLYVFKKSVKIPARLHALDLWNSAKMDEIRLKSIESALRSTSRGGI